MKKRISFIDISKCFAIIFIVLGHSIVHSLHCGIIFKLLYSFHVALFFILSGYTFNLSSHNKILNFIKNKFTRIMIPYFVWAVLFLIPFIILGKNVGSSINVSASFDLKTLFFNILYGNGNNLALKQNSSLWFLPALFSMELLYYLILKIFKNKNLYIILIISLVIGFICNYISIPVFPWGINTTFGLGAFFCFGYIASQDNLFTKDKLFKLYYMVPLLIIGIMFCFLNNIVTYIDYDYGVYLLFIISALCISLFVIYISYIINTNFILEYIGANSLGILIFHKLIITLFQTKFGIISSIFIDSNFILEFLIGILVVIISILFSLLVNFIISKTFPILIGKKKI